MRNLSKSRIISYRQCHKKLWLEVHNRELAEDSSSTQKSYAVGNQVGELATQLYDVVGNGVLIDPFKDGFNHAIKQTQTLLQTKQPIFEATFSIDGGLVMADVLMPTGKDTWRMIEVKSSTEVKNYHYDDIAVQTYVAQKAGLKLQSVALACLDNQWTYQGDGNYTGLLKEVDLSEHAFAQTEQAQNWFEEAHGIVEGVEPTIEMGEQCSKPFDCAFKNYCSKDLPIVEYPVSWLPRIQSKNLKQHIKENRVTDMGDVPDDLLNDKQLKVKAHTLSGETYFDKAATKTELAQYQLPAYFLDFETINLAVPIWAGTRPYQQIPFQFSLHVLDQNGQLHHSEFLNITCEDPTRSFADKLIELCGLEASHDKFSAPIYVYNRGFEATRIKELAERFPDLGSKLNAIKERLVDLWPIAEKHYYNPSQHGSWSIKKLLPAIAPDLNYEALDGVQDGGMAMDAYAEAISLETVQARKDEIENQLLKYCELDTLAMVRIWEFFK